VIVGSRGELPIPSAAWKEYGFQVGDEVTFIAGSRRSGGFGLSHARLLAGAAAQLQVRALAQGRVDESGRVMLPVEVGAKAGARLLAVRGSSRALGFVAHGPIYEEALKHPDLACFEANMPWCRTVVHAT